MTTDTAKAESPAQVMQDLSASASQSLWEGTGANSSHPNRHEWLDERREKIILVLEAFGPAYVAENLNFNINTLHSWRRRRGLQKSTAEWHADAARRNGAVVMSPEERDNLQGTAPLDSIFPNPYQPRRTMDPEALQELAESIATSGLLQTPIGRPLEGGNVQLAFGHRRVDAIRMLAGQGRWTGGAPVLLRPLTDQQMAVFALEENRKRKDISPLEEYLGYQRVVQDGLFTITDLATTLGIARPTLSNNLRLLNLPQVVLDRFGAGVLSAHAAREFLSLWAEDHAHQDDIAKAIEEIAHPSYNAPDWGMRNVRQHISHRVTSGNAVAWRPLSKKLPVYASYSAPTFDVEEFQRDFPTQVHHIPTSANESTLWTCNVREWQKRQSAATRAANKARGEGQNVDHPALPPERANKLMAVLENDPVRQAIAAGKHVNTGPVSAETLDSSRQEPATVNTGPVSAETPDTDDRRAQEFRQINEYIDGELLTMERRANNPMDYSLEAEAEDLSIEAIRDRLELEILTDSEIDKAIENAIRRYEDKRRKAEERSAATAVAPGLTEEEVEQLGTRATYVQLDRSAWYQAIDSPYSNLPYGFPDVEECLTKCTWGATYAETYPGDRPRLFCLNQRHFQEKLTRGRAAKWQEVLQEAEMEAEEDQAFAKGLLDGDMDVFLRHVVLSLLWEQGAHLMRKPQDIRDDDWGLPYSMSKRIQEVLGLPDHDPDDPARRYTDGHKGLELALTTEVVDKIEAMSAQDLCEMASQLIAYSHRRMAVGPSNREQQGH